MVSEIALGTWQTFGGGIADRSAREIVDTAFDLGITLIDTANVYNRGAAETFLGEVLASRPRDSYVLATKLEWTQEQIQAALDLQGVDLQGVERFVSSQPEYSLLHRDPEHGVFQVCAANGISQIVWSPLAQSVLTGKYATETAPPDDSRARSDRMGWAIGRYLSAEILDAVEGLRPIADELGLTLSQLALAWVLREPNVAAAIVGASRPEQLRENAAASGVALSPATRAAIDEVLARVVPA